MWLLALVLTVLCLFLLKDKRREERPESTIKTALPKSLASADRQISPDFDLPLEISNRSGITITFLRGIAGFILAIIWPLATFSLPFLFDDPRGSAGLGRVLYLGLYVAYPLTFFLSATKYKAALSEGKYSKALAQAASPIGVLLIFSLLLWAMSYLSHDNA